MIEAGRDEAKLQRTEPGARPEPRAGIVYASSRARCETVAAFLSNELRRETVVYHAGLTREQRTAAQERFMSGEAEIVVATNAFGMGVDKADIRSVVHFNLPGTLEAYYQEAGRAGRDGLPALCLLLYSTADRFLQELFIENEYPPRGAIYQVYEFLRRLDDDPIELTHAEIREAAGSISTSRPSARSSRSSTSSGRSRSFCPGRTWRSSGSTSSPTRRREPQPGRSAQPPGPRPADRALGLEGLVRGRLGEPVYFRPDEFAPPWDSTGPP